MLVSQLTVVGICYDKLDQDCLIGLEHDIGLHGRQRLISEMIWKIFEISEKWLLAARCGCTGTMLDLKRLLFHAGIFAVTKLVISVWCGRVAEIYAFYRVPCVLLQSDCEKIVHCVPPKTEDNKLFDSNSLKY